MKLASEGQLSTGRSPRAAATRPRSSASRATRVSISSTKPQGQAAGQLRLAREVVGQDHQLAGLDHWRGGPPGSRGGSPAIDHVFEKVRITTAR